GGYSRAEYWKDLPFVGLDGEPATWEQVKPLLVDADGKPGGPATWKDGSYPPGEDSHPVRGVSWYEAAAYARFAGKRLPSIYHWRAASVTGGWAARRSNFGPHLLPVEQLRGVEPFGTFGMFGNVKEWCANEDADGRRFILGGAWDEPEYMAVATTAHAPLAREHNFGFRCMAVLPDKEQPEEAWKLVRIRSWRDFLKEQADGELLDANSFQLIRHRYAYESRDVAAVTLADDDEGPWRHLKVRFDAAYNGADGKPEPLLAHLFLPSHARPPYQVIVYFPGLDAFSREHIKPLAREFRADELVRSGRALLYPVYKGTLERRRKALANLREHEELLIQMGQDLRRSLDYLKQRGDVDMDRLGYYGLSLGASNAHFLAVEDRFRAAVLMAGGMLNLRPPREYPLLDRTHYYPHINPKLPVLMVNGTLDTIFPVKESQIPLFKLLGSQIKEHYLQKGYGHSANEAALRKAVEWFDRHLGKPALRSTGDSP
ncbi:MAG: SUMF1/EgtB/PvdO family nonheme iron enzyme, partial [Gemmataceae bacterium]|nr:SUMF1/EgtB/PvdO family nonheme iron enzyme [Gemmataceae bacterium]